VDRVDSGGQTPRHFALDPSGRWMIVANQGSNNLVVFKRNPADGKIVAAGRSYSADMPTCVLFG
jgi:6-phosphogluconolactonase